MLPKMLADLFKANEITGINFDSRLVKAGEAFFAISGYAQDGNKFITDALNKGAKLIFTDNKNYANENIIFVENIRQTLADAANILYPDLPKYMVAATGTNGKTSIVNYCHQLFTLLGGASACIGSTGIYYSSQGALSKLYNPDLPLFTSYDPITSRKILSELAEKKVDYAALEASSHGIDQERLHSLMFDAAAFSSFTNDHLDYHPNKEHYLQAKLKLFKNNLKIGGIAVIYSKIDYYEQITSFFKLHNIKFITVGEDGDLSYEILENSIDQQKISVNYLGQKYEFSTNVIGSFQASNLLISALLVAATGFDFAKVIQHLPKLTSVQGRLERVTKLNSDYQVFVDFSHTPDALEQTLSELKRLKKPGGELKVIFGCGGNRDALKRPVMGAIAARIADKVIITDDNPRFEDPGLIRQQIKAGMFGKLLVEIPDRREAIILVIQNLKSNDILIIAGKGSENYQIIKDQKFPFSDFEIAYGVIYEK